MSDNRREKLQQEGFKKDDEQQKKLIEESKKAGNFDWLRFYISIKITKKIPRIAEKE